MRIYCKSLFTHMLWIDFAKVFLVFKKPRYCDCPDFIRIRFISPLAQRLEVKCKEGFLGITKLRMVPCSSLRWSLTLSAIGGYFNPATARGETGGLCAQAGRKPLLPAADLEAVGPVEKMSIRCQFKQNQYKWSQGLNKH